jgi:small conductance mechanosensitive channel
MKRCRRHPSIAWLLVAITAFCAASASAESEPEAKSASEEIGERFDALRDERISRVQEIAALETAAQSAVGDDRDALHRQALDYRLDATDAINDMWGLVEELESAEVDASEQRSFLVSLFPALLKIIPEQYDAQLAVYAKLKTDQAELSDAEALAAIEPAIKRSEDVLLRILDASIDVGSVADSLGIPTQSLSAWLEEKVQDRARLAMSHINLASQRRSDIEARIAAGADPAALQSAEATANARYEGALATLQTVVELMTRLELDDTRHRKLLVASTGEITVEAIDSEVVGDLVKGWADDLREAATDDGVQYAFQAVLIVLIASIFWGLSRFVRKVVGRAVEAPHLRFSQLLKRMLVSLSSGAVLILGFLVALSQLGIEIAPMLAGLGIAGFVLGFALQDTLGNFAAGVMILIYRPYDVGDMIDCAGGVFGQVSHMSLVSTTILTIDNKTLIVPNNKIWGDVITNVTAQAIRRVDLEFGIGYSDDIPHAEEVIWSIIKDHPKVLEDPEPVVKVHSLGDSSVNFVVRPWVARDDYWDVHWDFTREIKLRFDREGVSIPFPQRDVHFYTTDHGGPEANGGAMEVGSTALESTDEPESEA